MEIPEALYFAAMGVSLAACAGLRAFLPLFVVGVAGRFEVIQLSDGFAWLASWPALIVFGTALVAEMLADKFPVVDHLLDSVQMVVKPVAGALVAGAVVAEWSPLLTTVLWIIVGGSVAGSVHTAKASVRLASTATTAGAGNVVLSTGEDAGALAGSLGALVFPFIVLALAISSLLLTWIVFRRLRRRRARIGATERLTST